MIKLFRKIRQKFLLEGEKKKYLKYAFGEIFLVVIGILIALSINTWNSNRLQDLKNRKLLFKISKELDQHLDRIQGTLDASELAFKFRLIYSDSISKLLDKGIQPKDIDYIVKVPNYYTITLNFNTIVFNELINTGSLYSLSSDSLVAKIQNYYQLYEKEKFYNLEIGKTVLELKKPCHEGFFDFVYWYNKNPEKAFAMHNWIFDPVSANYRSFRNYITSYRNHSRMMVDKLTLLKEECYQLKNAINNELMPL